MWKLCNGTVRIVEFSTNSLNELSLFTKLARRTRNSSDKQSKEIVQAFCQPRHNGKQLPARQHARRLSDVF